METNWELEVFMYQEDGENWIKMRRCTYDYLITHASYQGAEVALNSPETARQFVESFNKAEVKEY